MQTEQAVLQTRQVLLTISANYPASQVSTHLVPFKKPVLHEIHPVADLQVAHSEEQDLQILLSL